MPSANNTLTRKGSASIPGTILHQHCNSRSYLHTWHLIENNCSLAYANTLLPLSHKHAYISICPYLYFSIRILKVNIAPVRSALSWHEAVAAPHIDTYSLNQAYSFFFRVNFEIIAFKFSFNPHHWTIKGKSYKANNYTRTLITKQIHVYRISFFLFFKFDCQLYM